MYKRVLLKFSGEALTKSRSDGSFDSTAVDHVVSEVVACIRAFPHIQLALMPGGGNHGRGSELIRRLGIRDRHAHQIGMLFTIVNALVVGDKLESAIGQVRDVRIMSAVHVKGVAEDYIARRADHHLKKGSIVIFGGGSGLTSFSTDSGAVNRAAELEMDAVLKGTKVDGVYDSDPRVHESAEFLPHISNQDFLARGFSQIFDVPAVADAAGHNLPVHVFNIFESGSLTKIIAGERVGTLIAPASN